MALISSQLQWLEAELESAIEECGQVVEQNNAWLAETIQKNTKNLQYQTNPSFECPRSQRKPVRRGRQKAMAAVTEEPEEKENTANGDVAAERDVVPRRLGLSARDDSTRDEAGSKRASEGDAPIGETKRVKRDQVAEIIAAADTANAAAAEAAISELKTSEPPPDFGKKRVPELRKELVALGLNDKGRKDELVERLTNHFLEQQAAAASTSTPAVASTAAAAPAAAPKPKQKAAAAPLPEGWKEYVDKATGKSYYYNASSATTTWERPKAASGRASSSGEIQIPTHKSSHSSVDDDESEDESGDEGGAGGKRKLPSWANPKELMSQLQRQHNPTRGDDVFGQQIHLMEEACALKEIFGSEVTNKRHHRRGSSGCWDLDRLTEQEEQAYQKSHNP